MYKVLSISLYIYNFLVVVLGITLYICNLSQSIGINILTVQAKYKNLTFILFFYSLPLSALLTLQGRGTDFLLYLAGELWVLSPIVDLFSCAKPPIFPFLWREEAELFVHIGASVL